MLVYCLVNFNYFLVNLSFISTQVGSLRVIQVGGFLFMIFGMLGKFGALFVTIPDNDWNDHCCSNLESAVC